MKKSILNIGNALNKTEQQQINGGDPVESSGCRSGACFGMPYVCQEGTNACAIPGPSGIPCFGTHDGNQCCLN